MILGPFAQDKHLKPDKSKTRKLKTPSTAAVRLAFIKVIKAYSAAFGDGARIKGNKIISNGMAFTVDVDKGLLPEDCIVKLTLTAVTNRRTAVSTATKVSTMVGAMARAS